jgi:hypothetical protein
MPEQAVKCHPICARSGEILSGRRLYLVRSGARRLPQGRLPTGVAKKIFQRLHEITGGIPHVTGQFAKWLLYPLGVFKE